MIKGVCQPRKYPADLRANVRRFRQPWQRLALRLSGIIPAISIWSHDFDGVQALTMNSLRSARTRFFAGPTTKYGSASPPRAILSIELIQNFGQVSSSTKERMRMMNGRPSVTSRTGPTQLVASVLLSRGGK